MKAWYKDSSGQQFNLRKSLICFGKRNPRSSRRIRDTFPITVANFPSRYMGAPLLLGYPHNAHFANLLAAIRKKLSGWKAESLSFFLIRKACSSKACPSKYAASCRHGSPST